ncbi:MAG: DUF1643 domain-containing protein [Nitrosomonas sp.]|uniref:DUF1643 domain-containing protein n=1 Tax=Nitrosomonas sp. TaxID=42353 RepID=UPI0025EFEB40|nr:DUF1643 domain-containing protein [Nitrosomonas sp.]MBY0473759.1 DUF1643 domain-containing protein [Nitrosomonas sp.]
MTTVKTGCIFSPCRTYRYTLWRNWIGGAGYAMFIGLNPSTADELQDDPTVRRCINFSKEWGFSALCMTNIFGYRATDPQVMKAVSDPVGPENDEMLIDVAKNAGVIIAAWGTHGVHHRRAEKVKQILGDKLMCLRLTKEGYPAHPLYLPKNLKPISFNTKLMEGMEILSK